MIAPIDPISAVQDAIIARLGDAFGMDRSRRALQEIKPLHVSPDRGADMIEQLIPPSLNLLFLEFQPTQQFDTVDLRWGVYAVSKRATLAARTKGDVGEMGAYAIAARAARVLNDFLPDVEGASALMFHGCQNIASKTLARKKLSVLALTFSGQVTIGFDDPNADLADFLRYHSEWKTGPFDDDNPAPTSLPISKPDATNDVVLTGASDAS